MCDDTAGPPPHMREHAYGGRICQGACPGGEVCHSLLAFLGTAFETGTYMPYGDIWRLRLNL